MSNVENIIIEHLKAIRTDIGGLKVGIADLTLRVGSVEQSVAGLRKDIAQLHGDMAVIHQRIDHVDTRVERIERRLEIVSHVNRGRERRSPSPPSEPGVQFSRDGLSSWLLPQRDWRANRWVSDIVNNPRSAKKAFGHCV